MLSCADRERINPLDPKNPETMGRPTGFTVCSIQDTVNLSWNSIALEDLVGFRIYRTSDLSSGFTVRSLVSPDAVAFKDFDVEFDVVYYYTISAVGETFESSRSDTVNIVPGPTFNWIAHTGGQQLLKLTHDARHNIHGTSGFFPIIDIEVDPNSGQVWVIERLRNVFGNAVRVSSRGEIIRPIIQFASPIDAAIDQKSGSLWVADNGAGLLVKLDSNGQQEFTLSRFQQPISVSVDQRTGVCWVADGQNNRLSKVSTNGQNVEISASTFDSIQSISVNSSDGSVWIANGRSIVQVDETGNLLQVVEGFRMANAIAVDDQNGEVWVVDFAFSSVHKIFANGLEAFSIDDFSEPRDIAINLFDHSCLVADTKNNRIIRVAQNGATASVFTQVTEPEVVAVQNRPRPN